MEPQRYELAGAVDVPDGVDPSSVGVGFRLPSENIQIPELICIDNGEPVLSGCVPAGELEQACRCGAHEIASSVTIVPRGTKPACPTFPSSLGWTARLDALTSRPCKVCPTVQPRPRGISKPDGELLHSITRVHARTCARPRASVGRLDGWTSPAMAGPPAVQPWRLTLSNRDWLDGRPHFERSPFPVVQQRADPWVAGRRSG